MSAYGAIAAPTPKAALVPRFYPNSPHPLTTFPISLDQAPKELIENMYEVFAEELESESTATRLMSIWCGAENTQRAKPIPRKGLSTLRPSSAITSGRHLRPWLRSFTTRHRVLVRRVWQKLKRGDRGEIAWADSTTCMYDGSCGQAKRCVLQQTKLPWTKQPCKPALPRGRILVID